MTDHYDWHATVPVSIPKIYNKGLMDLFVFSHVQCLHIILLVWIPTLQTSKSVQGETACGWVWAASPACQPAGWRSASLSGRTPSRQRGSPEKISHFGSMHLAKQRVMHSLDCALRVMINSKTFAIFWHLSITGAWLIICHTYRSRIKTNWMTDTLVLVLQLTVTSLPRLISVKTFFMPSPLPTCQIVASTGWLVIGQSLAWSSYQMVLKGGKGGGKAAV